MMESLPISKDAATVVGLAGSALPFADSVDGEVERWLRPLRLYGEAGSVLQSLGIGEARLTAPAHGLEEEAAHRPDETVAAILTQAEEFARRRGAALIGTADILVGVMRCYPRTFAQALESRGSDWWELTDRVAESLHAPLR